MAELKKGIAFGVGTGPGDPELMTLKACRIIRENEVIAVPGKDPKKTTAYKIAVQAVPELTEKKLLPIHMPMTGDKELLGKCHAEAASLIENYLDSGRNVVYLTLGDPTIYCSFSYIQHILESDGYRVELVSGVTSFCAAAASLGTSLAEWDEELHVLPALHSTNGKALEPQGNYVMMKSAGSMPDVKKMLASSGREVSAVENCGMKTEIIYRSTEEIPDDAGYLTLIIAKEKKHDI